VSVVTNSLRLKYIKIQSNVENKDIQKNNLH